MLVLTRTVGQKIKITTPAGEVIDLMVMDNWRGRVRIGFDANKDIRIMRSELLEPAAQTGPQRVEGASARGALLQTTKENLSVGKEAV